MKPLKNPYAGLPGYNCFGCSPANPLGLKMDFFEDGDEIVSSWEPGEHYQGYLRVLHGGIQATMLDELASWYVFVKLQTTGMTGSMSITYHSPVDIDKGIIEMRASEESIEKKRARIRCLLFQEGVLKSEALCEYVVFSRIVAEKKFHYPGPEAFYS